MKKSVYILSALLAFSQVGFTQIKGYDLEFKIKDLQDTVSYLGYYYGSKIYIKDTVKVENGRIRFVSDEENVGGLYLVILQDLKTYFEFIYNEKTIKMESKRSDFTDNMRVIKSDENKAFYKHLRQVQPIVKNIYKYRTLAGKSEGDSVAWYSKKAQDAQEEVEQIKDTFIKNYPSYFLSKIFTTSKSVEIPKKIKDNDEKINYMRAHYFDNIDLTDARLIYAPVLKQKTDYYIKNLHYQYPDSISTALDVILEKSKPNSDMFQFMLSSYLAEYERSRVMGMDGVFVHLAENYIRNKEGELDWFSDEEIEKITKKTKGLKNLILGKKAKDIVGADLDRRPVKLYDNNNKFTLLLFWDVNCGNCQKSMPKYKEIYKKFNARGFGIYAMSVGWTEKWSEYVKEHEYEWVNVGPTENETFEYYDVKSTPTTYLLDKDMKIIAKKFDPTGLENILQDLYSREKVNKENN